MTNKQKEWNAIAEVAMMGYAVPIESEEQLKHLVGYIIFTLRGAEDEERAKEIVNNATQKYNSGKDKTIKWFTCNNSHFGVLLTFVRDKGALTLKSGKMKQSGSLAWVENLDAPDCSELGYVFFENVNGKVRRVA